MNHASQLSIGAFLIGQSFKLGNTNVKVNDPTIPNSWTLELFGNPIAIRTGNRIRLMDCGWQTKTTKERLNAILSSCGQPLIVQKKRKWYHNGAEWNGTYSFNN